MAVTLQMTNFMHYSTEKYMIFTSISLPYCSTESNYWWIHTALHNALALNGSYWLKQLQKDIIDQVGVSYVDRLV